MLRYLMLVLTLMAWPSSGYATDQIIPVTATNYHTAIPFVESIVDLVVAPPVGATEIVGWTGRVQAGPGTSYTQINWYHDGGNFHWLDGQNFANPVMVNAVPVFLPAGSGHKLTQVATVTVPSTDLVFSKVICFVPMGSPSCLAWVTFYFRVP